MRVYLDSIGCRLNQAEIETIARQFHATGHEIVAIPEEADLAVVNTCAVTAQAASDSRARIRQLALSGEIRIVATGCWVTLQPQAAAAMTGVSHTLTNDHKEQLVANVLSTPVSKIATESVIRQPLPGRRHRTRAFIKVQDGCDNRCTFCITTLARGKSRSRILTDVIGDIFSALEGGAHEIVLTGVHLGAWGKDLDLDLKYMVSEILRQTLVPRLRLSSLEPWDLDPEFFLLWKDPRLCRHLHLPLQSGCAATLRRMARNATPESFRRLVASARSLMPEIAITTDLIAGFPGESQDEFEESLDFVRSMNFAGGHAFTFSPRPSTAAARMRDQVPTRVRRARTSTYRSMFEEAAKAYRCKFLGRLKLVLWESAARVEPDGWQLGGLTDNNLRVQAFSTENRWNRVDQVILRQSTSAGLLGVISES